MPGGQPPRTGAFISYSHADTLYLNQLRVSLKASMRQQPLDIWDDTMIQPGDHWRAAIERALAKARVAVLLVSPDFLASDFITDNELPPLLAAAEQEGLVVLPVIVRRSLYEESPLGLYQTINPPDKPLNAMTEPERDEVWVRLTRRIKAVLEAPQPVGTILLTYTDYADPVGCIAWSPDGKRIAAGDFFISIWDAQTGETFLPRYLELSGGEACAWSPDSRRLASVRYLDQFTGSRPLHVWDAQTGQQFFSSETFGYSLSADCVAWSPDSHMLAVSSFKLLYILDASTGQRIVTHQDTREENVWRKWRSLVWSPDGHLIIGVQTFSRDMDDLPQVEVWQFPTQAGPSQGNHMTTYRGHQAGVYQATLSPDGARVASASQDGVIHIWDARTAQTVCVCQGTGLARVLVWSPDGHYLATATGYVSNPEDTSIRVWDTQSGALVYTYTGTNGPVCAVAWSPNGKRIASGGWKKVRVWVAP